MDEFEQIKAWLTNVLGYPQYVDTFKANGFDQWNILIHLEWRNLSRTKSIKIGHAIRIMNELKAINIANMREQMMFKQKMNVSIRSMLDALAAIIKEYEYEMKKETNTGTTSYFEHILSSSESMMREITCQRDEFESRLHKISSMLCIKPKQKIITNKIASSNQSKEIIDDCAPKSKRYENGIKHKLNKVVLTKKIIAIIMSYLDDESLENTTKDTKRINIFDDFVCASGKILSIIMEYAIDTKQNEQSIAKAAIQTMKEKDVQTLNKFVQMKECIVKLLLLHQSKMSKIEKIQRHKCMNDSHVLSQENAQIISTLKANYHTLSSKMYQAIHMIKFYDSHTIFSNN